MVIFRYPDRQPRGCFSILDGKKYLVTGGSRGIGRSTVLSLAEAGATVAFTYSTHEKAAREVKEEAERTGGSTVAFCADVTDYQKAREVVDLTREKLGGLDGVVLNAGITKDSPLVMMQEESWDDVIATNLKGTFNYARAALYGMIRQRYGRIICVSSVSGLVGVAGQTNYAATKAGQIGFLKALSKEAAPYGITVNAVSPGFIETDLWKSIPEQKHEQILKQIPLGRLGSSEEVAGVIRFLLSPTASYMTGSVLVVDGGLSS
ncbi:beta-ketoacyl-ACP reductase [Kroppenstedtia pulmonis]|uniref:Beta-ketoacyl-ACP reductase n=1 Tax=Kroppenstedtia pulmonis TaxID=1380685 RepID=A0A7D4C4G1_9BACL|nr:beta-ketoacyl-ACP reductase [Kroppenstedtia pulmonis]QKG83256.1 beta-ketoacyl-ACP reductase [Kroppenstedtia pulmonis]